MLGFIPKLVGIACAHSVDEHIDFKRKISISKFTEENLKRIEAFNYSQIKHKKRKKVSYLDRVKSINDKNRKIFNQFKTDQNVSFYNMFLIPINSDRISK